MEAMDGKEPVGVVILGISLGRGLKTDVAVQFRSNLQFKIKDAVRSLSFFFYVSNPVLGLNALES